MAPSPPSYGLSSVSGSTGEGVWREGPPRLGAKRCGLARGPLAEGTRLEDQGLPLVAPPGGRSRRGRPERGRRSLAPAGRRRAKGGGTVAPMGRGALGGDCAWAAAACGGGGARGCTSIHVGGGSSSHLSSRQYAPQLRKAARASSGEVQTCRPFERRSHCCKVHRSVVSLGVWSKSRWSFCHQHSLGHHVWLRPCILALSVKNRDGRVTIGTLCLA